MQAFTHAFAVGQVTIKDQQLWQKYKTALSSTLVIYDGEVTFRGKLDEVFAGKKTHTDVVFVKFASIDALKTWFYSKEYQAIIPLRNSAADVTLTSYAP